MEKERLHQEKIAEEKREKDARWTPEVKAWLINALRGYKNNQRPTSSTTEEFKQPDEHNTSTHDEFKNPNELQNPFNDPFFNDSDNDSVSVPFDEQFKYLEDSDFETKLDESKNRIRTQRDMELEDLRSPESSKKFNTALESWKNRENIAAPEEEKKNEEANNKEEHDKKRKARYEQIQHEIDEENAKLTQMKNKMERYEQILQELNKSKETMILKDNPLRTEVNKILVDFDVDSLHNMKDRNKIIKFLYSSIGSINKKVSNQETVTKEKRESLIRYPPTTSGNIINIKSDNNNAVASNPPLFV